MSSTTRKIAPSEWERHKDTIVELYRNKPLKDVRAEMQGQHGFDASSWQYEMQLKRWNIRKNATRREWQRYFAANKDQPVANSRGDGPGTNIAPVILSKSTASKKRASRWVPGSIVTPKPVPAPHAVLAPRVFESTWPSNEGYLSRVLSLDEPIMALRNIRPGYQHAVQNTVDSLHATASPQLLNEFTLTDNFTTDSLLGSPSQAFTDVRTTPGLSLDFSCTLLLQSPLCGLSNSDLAPFSLRDLPTVNNTAIVILQEIRQELPFALFEQSIQSRGIMLEKSAGHTVFGGFAPRVVAGILSSKDQSMLRQTPDLQRLVHLLGTQVPGENSALVTDDQAFETKFARLLLFSMLNGFAGLDGIPMENILRFLNQFLVNKLFLDVLEQIPRYVARTLTENIFRAAIEAEDTKLLELLASRRLIEMNWTVFLRYTKKYAAIERASKLRSPNLMKLLIDAGAVNVTYTSSPGTEISGALKAPTSNSISHERRLSETDEWRAIQSESIEALKMVLIADVIAQEHIYGHYSCTIKELRFFISQNASLESHRDFFQREELFISIFIYLDDRRATRLVQHLISLCHKADCNKCLAGLGVPLRRIVAKLVSEGKLGLVQLLFQEADMTSELSKVFLAAIKSKNPALIDFILSLGPDLDPPAIKPDYKSNRRTTPIAEAVRHGNERLIRILEEKGCLDHLKEGDRFEAAVAAAAETGNSVYMRKLLARAVTSKEAYRVEFDILDLALDESHPEIVQMLLEAGADASRSSILSLPGTSIVEGLQSLHALIAFGAHDFERFPQEDRSIVAVLINEFPGFHLDSLERFFRKCIDTDMLDYFRTVLQTLDLRKGSLDDCLLVAVKLGHGNLVEYLLDMGANPFHNSVLQVAIPDKPDMLRLLMQKERRKQTMPKCIGAQVLEPLMGNCAGNAEALDELIKTGAINFVRLEVFYENDRLIELTPLGMAIHGVPDRFDSNVVVMRKFLDAGADPNGISKSHGPWTKGSPLMTALMVAIETGLEDAVNMLLDYGADVNARPRIRTTRTALQFSAELGNIDMVRLLLSRGADANSSASSRGGATALQFASMAGNCNMVAELLDLGAQLDALPSKIDGMWPLEGAAANGRLNMIRYLWEMNVRAVAGGMFPDGFSERHCLRAMYFARENLHMGCMDLISDLTGISEDRLETDEYGAPWIAY